MIVCICHRVSDRDIAQIAQNGCASFDELQFELRVATSCGKCHDCARETFDRHAAAHAASASSCSHGGAGHVGVHPIVMRHPRENAAPAGA